MKEITEFLAASKMPTVECIQLLNLISEYGKNRWVEGFNKASDISGYGTPPEPTVRNEVRNAPIVNNPHPDGGHYGC